VSTSKNTNIANYNSSILLVHKPNVILAWEEAAELEIANTPKQMWPRMELQKHKRAACWHGNCHRAGTTEAEVEQCQAGMCGSPWICFAGLGKTTLQIHSLELQSNPGPKKQFSLTWQCWRAFWLFIHTMYSYLQAQYFIWILLS
jgi:hypothetical protein